MIKLSFHPYVLNPLTALNSVSAGAPRTGALFKVDWVDGQTGYADLHPWMEFGDESLETQIEKARRGQISLMLKQTIELARRDAVLRKEGKSIQVFGENVRNNFLVTQVDQITPEFLTKIKGQGFTTVKMKAGRDLGKEAAAIKLVAVSGLKVRLDFNGAGSWQIFKDFMMDLSSEERAAIEYVEDPFPFEESTWADAQKLVKIALDAPYEQVKWAQLAKPCFDVVIIKPAKMNVEQALERCQKFNLKATVTSYMDHPVGVMHALGVAIECQKKYPQMMLESGCLTHLQYQANAFSEEMKTQGPYLLAVPGAGIGFNNLLEAIVWQPVQLGLNFDSKENLILLNPRWPEEDYKKLQTLAETVQAERGLTNHVWIATSGSTADSVGATKLVALSKTALQASAIAVNAHLQATAQDIWTQVLPHFHVGGLGIEIRAQLSGAKVVKALKNDKWDPEYFYQTLLREKCTLSALVPTQVYDLVERQYQAPEHLRAIVVGGGALDMSLFERARELGWPLLPSYGMTETASQIATASLESLNDAVYPAIELLSHAQARTNADGFLEVTAESLFTCYAQNTPEGIRHWDPKIANWFTTEDRGVVEGRSLKIEGRSKDYVKIGGEGTNVARLRALLEQSALDLNPQWPLQVTLLDMPSERLGAEIHMVTTLSSDKAQKIADSYSEKVLPFEKIRKMHIVNEIPRSDLGKILWMQLKNYLQRSGV